MLAGPFGAGARVAHYGDSAQQENNSSLGTAHSWGSGYDEYSGSSASAANNIATHTQQHSTYRDDALTSNNADGTSSSTDAATSASGSTYHANSGADSSFSDYGPGNSGQGTSHDAWSEFQGQGSQASWNTSLTTTSGPGGLVSSGAQSSSTDSFVDGVYQDSSPFCYPVA